MLKKDDPKTAKEWQAVRDTILLVFYKFDVDAKSDYWVGISNVKEALKKNTVWEISSSVIKKSIDYWVGKGLIDVIVEFYGGDGQYKINSHGIDKAEKIQQELPKRQNFDVLNHFFELSKAKQKDFKEITFNSETVSTEMGLLSETGQKILDRLNSEDLIEVIPGSNKTYRITDRGVEYLGKGTNPERLGIMPLAEVSNKVFIVHGHNNEVKLETARFIERLGLEAIILHEQANKGRTIIEKFTDHSDVGFAVVLLTGDDIGKAKGDDDKTYKPRARQNVILELGFFLGKLGRDRVCAIYQEGVEIPSDYSGVIWVPLDSRDSWKYDVAKELKAAGFAIDMNKI